MRPVPSLFPTKFMEERPVWKKVVLGVVAVVVVFVVVVALRPSQYKVERSTTIAASPADVFTQVNDFHAWDAWSPWAKLDPASKSTFSGSSSGQGAVFAWAGNDKVGVGKMTLTESHPNDLIRIRLEFIEPFADTAQTVFTFKPEGPLTRVTWTMSGRSNFLGKAVCMFMNMDKVVGGSFEEGLVQMKSVVEAKARTTSNDAPKAVTAGRPSNAS
ncbi:SRPBCC family protein [Singulisphaera rosea]